MLSRSDPLQEALNAKRSSSFYSIPAAHSNFFKTRKYDLEHFGLSFGQRLVCFTLCLVSGVVLLLYSFLKLPVAVLYPMAFVTPYAFSNICFFSMFGFLLGFRSYLTNLFSKTKRVWTAFFLGATMLSFYSAVFGIWAPLRVLLVVTQIVSFVCFAITFLPGGAAGITSLVSIMFKK